jgi:F0F1-type ATP synthase assembly protein I
MAPPARTSFDPAGAGMVLLSVTVASILVGALIGWLAGSWGLGALGGAVVGIPAGVFVVYRRYRGAFS